MRKRTKPADLTVDYLTFEPTPITMVRRITTGKSLGITRGLLQVSVFGTNDPVCV